MEKVLAIFLVCVGFPLDLYIISRGDTLLGIVLILIGVPHVVKEYIKYVDSK